MISSKTLTRPVNGRRAIRTVIGCVHLRQPLERKITYETASWYTIVSVPPGDYEVVLHEDGIKWVLIRYHGTIIDEHFVNRLFTSSSISPKRDIGKERDATAQIYPYLAAEKFATDPSWELAEDWNWEVIDYPSGTGFHLIGPDGSIVR